MPDLSIENAYICQTVAVFERTVKGSKGATYKVTFGRVYDREYEYGWSCTCPASQFRSKRGEVLCKHAQKVKQERCAWNETMDPGLEAEGPAGAKVCPKCKGPVQVERVAV